MRLLEEFPVFAWSQSRRSQRSRSCRETITRCRMGFKWVISNRIFDESLNVACQQLDLHVAHLEKKKEDTLRSVLHLGWSNRQVEEMESCIFNVVISLVSLYLYSAGMPGDISSEYFWFIHLIKKWSKRKTEANVEMTWKYYHIQVWPIRCLCAHLASLIPL